jgi:hypothetical protein
MDDGVVGVQVPLGVRFSIFHSVQTDSGDHPASYPTGNWASFPGGKPTWT